MKKTLMSIVVGASLSFSGAALAADPIQLACPAGTKQVKTSQLEIGCQAKGAGPMKAFEGPVVRLHPNGVKAEEGQQANGLRVGTWTFYDEKGNKTVTVQLQDSQVHGKRTEFWANGMVKKVETFEHDRRVGDAQEFDQTGKLITKVTAR